MSRKWLTLQFLMVISPGLLLAEYWQQQVNYDIEVILVDSVHQVRGHETITYINNSPDNLSFIWMHLWPNAYKNNKSALAKQKFSNFSTKMHFLPDSSFGWIEISNVTASGQTLNWEYRSADTLDVAKFVLNQTLLPGDTLTINLDFTLRVPNVLSRLGHFGQHYELTQWYPKPAVYDLKGWHPISYLDQGEFYSEWGNFEVSITLPENYRVAATGVLQDSSELSWRDSLAHIGNSYLDSFKLKPRPKLPGLKTLISDKPASSQTFKTITFKQDNVHDFAWFADKRFIILKDSVELPSGQLVNCWTFALPKNLKNYRLSNTYIGASIAYFSDWFMAYPYDHATVVDGDFSAGGGMEYPMITLINNTSMPPMLELVIMHEIGHNWFYGLSGSNERDYPWMDEGLNSYAENRYWAAKYPDNSMLALHEEKPKWYPILEYFIKDATKSAIEDMSVYASVLPRTDQAPDRHSEAFSRSNYGMMVYKKTALSTAALQAYLGEALMDSVWHTYFDLWAYKHPQPEDIRQVFEDVSGEDLSWYFEDMLGSTARIDYALDGYSSIPRGKGFETTIKISNYGDFNPPLAIGLSGHGESKTVWVRPTGKYDVFQIQTNFQVQDCVLDPDLLLIDVNRANNDRRLNLKFNFAQLSINPQDDYIVNLIPYIWYDSVDLISYGLILSHRNLISWGNMDWSLRMFMGPITKSPGFSASIGKKRYPQRGREIYYRSRLARDWYYQLGGLSINFRKRDLKYSHDERNIKFSLLAQDLSHPEILVNQKSIRYLDPHVWEVDQFVKTTFSLEKKMRRTLWSQKFHISTSLGAQKKGKPYARVQSFFTTNHRYSEKGSIQTTLFAGYGSGDLPSHERFYLSTDIDSEMNNKLVFSRDFDWYTPGHLVIYPSELTIPGFTYVDSTSQTPSTAGLVGAKVSVDIPKLERVRILAGVAMILDQNNSKLQAIGSISPILDLGPIRIIYSPFRLENDTFGWDWTRFQIGISFGSTIRIGN